MTTKTNKKHQTKGDSDLKIFRGGMHPIPTNTKAMVLKGLTYDGTYKECV